MLSSVGILLTLLWFVPGYYHLAGVLLLHCSISLLVFSNRDGIIDEAESCWWVCPIRQPQAHSSLVGGLISVDAAAVFCSSEMINTQIYAQSKNGLQWIVCVQVK